MENLYDQLPNEILAQFFFYITKNINEGGLSKAMNFEINLIKNVLKKRGLSVECLSDYL